MNISAKAKIKHKLALLAALLVGLSIGAEYASAHSLYIQSSRHKVDQGKSTPLFFCYGHHFPVDDGLRRNKLRTVKVHDPSGQVAEIPLRNETCLHSYMVEYDLPGTYVLTGETNPGYYTQWIDQKGRRRHTIKPMSELKDQASEIITSLYSRQYAKTYVFCSEPSAEFPAHIGLDFELVPQSDISRLKPGDVLELKIYKKGKPFNGKGEWDATFSGFSTEAEDLFYPKSEIEGGIIRVSLTHPGRWFIRFSAKADAPVEQRDQFKQTKDTATLVIELPNQRKRPRTGGH